MSTSRLSDTEARKQALDPRASFIVQAPAGSGKTELLTQRYLVLLNNVNLPEEILAITFTKKSAHEMRSRIIKTLQNAALSNQPPEAEHALKTWQLAKNVLRRNQELQWNLLSNPNRLKIQTIDSFNASLTKNLPILAQFGASPEITDNPTALYAEAIQELLSHLEEDVAWSTAIAQLLLHMDNDLNKVQQLLINMLAKRDQWLPHISLNANDPEIRAQLENYLHNVINDTLTHLDHIFPKELTDELLSLMQFSATNLGNSEVITDIDDITSWLSIANFLLTKEHKWRKQFTVKEGFPAPGKDLRLKEFKDRAIALVHEFHDHDDVRMALEELRQLPSAHFSETQWDILNALHIVLQIAVAQLNVIFQKYGKIDYIENALAALHALGTDDAPTDIALALDYRIQHILVDEFQDTANMQYRLLGKLTAGWEWNDGRTLFVVGDPMQSIYRFREAEVGLFIRARKQGLKQIQLTPLTLAVNFRSTSGIVNWVNNHFKKIFPRFEDIATGAVTYSESIANSESNSEAVFLHPATDQANKIIELIQQAKSENPDGTIAILVRTRTHLKTIIPALKAAHLAYRAIKIDPLNLRPTIQDLMSLTRALIHPADRIAWLSVLRAPWCGLTLSDLLILTGEKTDVPFWKQLQSSSVIASLSIDGQQRLSRILPILKEKVAERRRYTLRQWIESTWILLGGPACVEQSSDLEDAAAYFNLLEKLDIGGDLSHPDALIEAVTQLFAAPDNQADDKLQIMTIHNAKGLEFDTVILPHLERKASQDDKQLLLWMERPREEEDSDLIIGPVNAIGEEVDSIHEYIKRQIKIKSRHEDARLLYVAATRAKQKLHLLFSVDVKNEEVKVTANSLLDRLWPAIKDNVTLIDSHANIKSFETETDLTIKRLQTDWSNPIQEYQKSILNNYHNKSAGFLLPDHQPRIIGTVMHIILQQLARLGFSWWQEKNISDQDNYLTSLLIQFKLPKTALNHAISLLRKGLDHIQQDKRAQWILHKHAEHQSEFSITSHIDNEIVSLIIDRTFIDESGTRWIIDYKTSIFSHDDLENFLQNEQQKYKKQLWQYHQALQHIDARPIHVGLYFPLIPAWKEWSF